MNDLTGQYEYWKALPLKKITKLYRASCLLKFYAAVCVTLLAIAACLGLVTLWENNLYVAVFTMKFLIWGSISILFIACRNLVGRVILFLLTGIGTILLMYGFFTLIRLGWGRYIAQIVFCIIMYVFFYSTFWIALQKELFIRKYRLTHNGIKLFYKSIRNGKDVSLDDLQQTQTAKKYFTYTNIVFCISMILSLTCICLGLLRAKGIIHI